MHDAHESPESYISIVIIGWCEEALRQGLAILAKIEEMNYAAIDNAYGCYSRQCHAHEDFFVYALTQILDWGKGLPVQPDILKDFIAECDANIHVKDIRDMRVHAADYFCSGRKPFRPDRFTVDHGEGIGGDASSTFSSKETGYLIGGRLPLQTTMQKIVEILPEIKRLHDNIMEEIRRSGI